MSYVLPKPSTDANNSVVNEIVVKIKAYYSTEKLFLVVSEMKSANAGRFSYLVLIYYLVWYARTQTHAHVCVCVLWVCMCVYVEGCRCIWLHMCDIVRMFAYLRAYFYVCNGCTCMRVHMWYDMTTYLLAYMVSCLHICVFMCIYFYICWCGYILCARVCVNTNVNVCPLEWYKLRYRRIKIKSSRNSVR